MMKSMLRVRRVMGAGVGRDKRSDDPTLTESAAGAASALRSTQPTPHASRPVAAGLHFAAIDPAGEFGGAARGQDARLLHPVLALDAALEVERLADAVYVRGGPIGDLLVGDHAHLIELLLDQHADAADPLQVLERRRAQHLGLG